MIDKSTQNTKDKFFDVFQRKIDNLSPGVIKENHPYYFKEQRTILFLHLFDDQFLIYGEEIFIKKTLEKLNYPKNTILLESIGIELEYQIEGYIVSYRMLHPFIKTFGDHWDVKSVRKWMFKYYLIIVNTEEDATREIKTTHDIDRFFDWCYKNQKLIYAGTLHQHYLSLKNNGRLKYFLYKLSDFFFKAKDVNLDCKKWYMKYIPRMGKKVRNTINGNVPNARIIYTPMGGQNKRK